jgi:hypothetical protein
MRRVVALLMGALAGVVALRLIGRRKRSRAAVSPASADAGPAEGGDRASQLRRKLDEARERGGESVGPAQVVEPAADEDAGANGEPTNGESTNGEPSNGESGTVEDPAERSGRSADASELDDRRARVHGRARDAAETMRNGGDSGAA